jgi:Zn-dependent M28 family amino/carboxypeptidase
MTTVMTGNKIVRHLVFLVIVAVMAACGSSERDSGSRDTGAQDITRAQIPVFNADSAYQFVARQVAFGPRVPNTRAHQECGDWLEQTLGAFADTLYVQNAKVRAYDGTILNIRNFIGSFQPDKVNRILLCAHWDSRPWADHDPNPANHFTPIDGANDGASGVGVLLEIARQLSISNPRVGVDILLLDAEDYGKHQASENADMDSWALGSQHWSKYPHKYDYNARFGILLDMVGASNATFLQEGYSMMFAPNIVRKVWDIAARQGYGSYFVKRDGGYIMDDHYYINTIRNIPVINIIDLRSDTPHGFYEHWHTLKDNMDAIDPTTLKAVGQTVAAVLWLE